MKEKNIGYTRRFCHINAMPDDADFSGRIPEGTVMINISLREKSGYHGRTIFCKKDDACGAAAAIGVVIQEILDKHDRDDALKEGE